MAIVRFNSAIPTLSNSIFADYLSDFPVKTRINAKTDVIETDSAFEVHVSLPGFKKDDIKVEVEENKLSISGERKTEKQEENKKYHLVESEYGLFNRTFTLPKNAKTGSIEANYKDGILQLIIPKEDKEEKKLSISIN